MIRNARFKQSFSLSFLVAILVHLVILFFVKKNEFNYQNLVLNQLNNSRPLKVDRIELIKPEDVEKFRRVGIKNGSKKEYLQPDMLKFPKAQPQGKGLSLENLSPKLPPPKITKKLDKQLETIANKIKNTEKAINELKLSTKSVATNQESDQSSHFYFNPKKEKKIVHAEDQEDLKAEAFKNLTTSASNPLAQKMSNFEIRYERPEGISEDELNSDEKAYYSFFKRSYASYLSKLYATYEKISVERPGLERDFENKHLLIGRIDYDEKGNIVLVKILKSSESDNVHYFFEETLKQLNLPNPPKSFIKAKKKFSTYYQIQIN